MKLLLFACVLSVVFAADSQDLTRGVDGGDGEFTAVCVLNGYYQFSSPSVVYQDITCCDSASNTEADLLVHFYQRGPDCYADLIFTSFTETWCETALTSSPPEGNTYQAFSGTVGTKVEVLALSQSEPVIYVTSNCCMQQTHLRGKAVDDVNTFGSLTCTGIRDCPCDAK